MSGGAAAKGALTKIYTYSRTMKSTSDYAMNMKRLSNQIFGESKTKLNHKSRVMMYKLRDEPKEQSEKWINYYPAVEETNELMRVLRDYGLFRDEHKDFCEEMQRLRVLRGKAKERQSWKDGKPPEKIIKPRYDGQNSYKKTFY